MSSNTGHAEKQQENILIHNTVKKLYTQKWYNQGAMWSLQLRF